MTRNCMACGSELNDEYTIHEYDVPDPHTYGLVNPVLVYALDELIDGDDDRTYTHKVILCTSCTPDDVDPDFLPERINHVNHAALVTFALAVGLHSFGSPEVSLLASMMLTVLSAVVLTGEVVQMRRLTSTTNQDVQQAIHDDVISDTRDAYLEGEITLEEFEDRLEETEKERELVTET